MDNGTVPERPIGPVNLRGVVVAAGRGGIAQAAWLSWLHTVKSGAPAGRRKREENAAEDHSGPNLESDCESGLSTA